MVYDFCSSAMFIRLLIKLFFTVIIMLNGVYGQGYFSKLASPCSDAESIHYPFWMKDDAVKRGYHYGYPGMSISCLEGRPVINISNHLYYVHNINYYDNGSRGVLDILDVDTEGTDCPQPRHNVSLDDTVFENSFYKTIFHYNCTKYPPQDVIQYYYHLQCLDHVDRNVTLRSFIFTSYSYWDAFNWYENCEETVELPNFSHDGNFTQLLKFGFQLRWDRPDSSLVCEESGGYTLFNESGGYCLCYNDYPSFVHESVCPKKKSGAPLSTTAGSHNYRGLPIKVKVIIGVCAGLGAFLVIIALSYRRLLSSTGCIVRNQSNVEVFLENCGSLAKQRYKYSDIKKMTDLFKEKLGQGGFGAVFKGKIEDGRLVAVKVLNGSKSNGEDFINEVATISMTNHVNVVNLIGFCSEGKNRALVYQFMPNGSLEKFIYNVKTSCTPVLLLGWDNLYRIALGIAKGLEYLHRGCNTRILHFDIKPHNILLDEDFCPKIADFGLAKLCPTKESVVSMLVARGTIGYIAPEVYCRNFGGVSHKSDVYSYGMMVLEMIGRRKNIDVSVENMSEIYFPQWIYNHFKLDVSVDGCGEIFEDQNAKKMITVALWCIQTQPAARPSISKVVEMLEGTTEEMEMPPNPFQDPPSSSSP